MTLGFFLELAENPLETRLGFWKNPGPFQSMIKVFISLLAASVGSEDSRTRVPLILAILPTIHLTNGLGSSPILTYN